MRCLAENINAKLSNKLQSKLYALSLHTFLLLISLPTIYVKLGNSKNSSSTWNSIDIRIWRAMKIISNNFDI